MTKIRVLIAEDHATVRHGLKLLIDKEPDMEVVAEAADGRTALERVISMAPAVAVLDISMPEVNGLEATRLLRVRAPATAIVALTRHTDAAYVRELIEAGALGYVLKQSASQELLTAIRAAARGESHLDPNLTSSAPAARARRPPHATGREAEVLKLMAFGHSNKEIASALAISVKTVEVHKTNAMRKLGLQGRSDVMKYAMLQGWLRDLQ